MKIVISPNAQILGKQAAATIAQLLNDAIHERGYARLILSTGQSQFETLEALIAEDVDWRKVTMFHLDEYVGLPASHPASFRKYLTERFVAKVPLRQWYPVADDPAAIPELQERIREQPVDVGVIGIGENAHIAFNDPPADFATREAYRCVDLDERCKQQQVGEGWFATNADVPKQAISMTVYQIMQCRHIVSCVPHAVKANALMQTLHSRKVDPQIPATMLKEHPDFYLFADSASAALLVKEQIHLGDGMPLEYQILPMHE